ncbi:hypothetical protein ABC382_00180 [Lysinibacillus sp. 1P01SD]|uniref:hypothetical protein n=1 Tax=Lysinibacillus sp. 1P01SD TaxID=3132285 RepID=UPI0039A0425B
MIGIKGKNFLDAVWEIASERGCACETDDRFSQDCLGELRCDGCNNIIVSQSEVDDLEKNSLLPKPNISKDKLNN